MKKLYVEIGDATFEAERITKTSDAIIGYIGDAEVFSFKGINNFDVFQLESGYSWDLSDVDIKALCDIDFDFRISLLEMGVNLNDL